MANLRLQLDDDELRAVEARRRELNRTRKRRLSRADVLRRAIRVGLGLEADTVRWPEIPDEDAAVAAATRAVAAVYEAHVAPRLQREAARIDQVRELFERCRRRWDAAGATPLQFAAAVERIAPGLERDALFEWYYRGAVPEDAALRDALVRAVEAYLTGVSGRSAPVPGSS